MPTWLTRSSRWPASVRSSMVDNIHVTWLTETWGFTIQPYSKLYQPVIRVGAGLVITEGRYFETERSIREYVQQQLCMQEMKDYYMGRRK